MRRRSPLLALFAALMLLGVAALPVAAGTRQADVYRLTLTGDQEATATCAPPAVCGDPDATASMWIQVHAVQDRVCFRASWSSIDGTVVAAHIHPAPVGVPGPVAIPLFEGTFAGTDSTSRVRLGERTRGRDHREPEWVLREHPQHGVPAGRRPGAARARGGRAGRDPRPLATPARLSDRVAIAAAPAAVLAGPHPSGRSQPSRSATVRHHRRVTLTADITLDRDPRHAGSSSRRASITRRMLSSATAARVALAATGRRVADDRLYLKAENLQKTGSFKPRAALSRIGSLSADERLRGAITISAGNAGQAYAWAGREAGVPVTVVMPAGAVRSKVDACRATARRWCSTATTWARRWPSSRSCARLAG